MKKLKHEIKCVVFDLDGTIMDSEKVWKDTSLLLNKKYAINMDDDFRLFCCGRSNEEIVKTMQTLFPHIDASAVRQEWENMVQKHIEKHGVLLKDGFKKLLNFIKERNLKIGLATGSVKEIVSDYFRRNNLDENKIFDQIITVQEVKKGKPKPQIYKKLCKKLDVEAKNCLCIEDSPNGAKAAWRAGMNVLLVPDVFKPTRACRRRCCAILNDLNEVIDFMLSIKQN